MRRIMVAWLTLAFFGAAPAAFSIDKTKAVIKVGVEGDLNDEGEKPSGTILEAAALFLV